MLTPRPYQYAGRDFLAERQKGYLADEMRVGKTPQAIMAANKIRAKRVVVTCPAIAVEHWRREFPRWWHLGGEDIALPERLVVSFDKAKLSWTEITGQRWNVFIPDEAHFAKSPDAARTKLVFGKTGIGWSSDNLWPLSGTPAPKHAGELWAWMMAFGLIGKMSYQDFCARYCRLNAEGLPTGTKEAMIPELRALMAPALLRRTRKDVAPEMPGIDFNFLEIETRFNKDVDIPANVTDDRLLEWVEAHAGGDRENRIDIALAKVGPLGDEIEFAIANGLLKQTVVFGWHIEPLEKLASSLRARGLRVGLLTGATSAAERQFIQQDFLGGLVDVVVAQLLAAGTAIDLSAARHGYFLELDWVPGNNVQAANRLISMDKLDKVTIDVATMPRTMDDRIQHVLLRRTRELSKLY